MITYSYFRFSSVMAAQSDKLKVYYPSRVSNTPQPGATPKQELKLKYQGQKCLNKTWKTKYSNMKAKWTKKRDLLLQSRAEKSEVKKQVQRKIQQTVGKIFTPNQLKLLKNSKSKTHWKEEDVSKALCLRAKSPAAYEFVRSCWKIPLPCTSTLKTWITKIKFSPGLLNSVLNLLKTEFIGAEEMYRQSCLSFDEMSLDGSVCNDPGLDKIYGPHKNLLVAFARGLFGKWKQPVYYGFDDKLGNNKVLNIITSLHDAGINVVATTCDNAPTNKGIWN